MAEIVHLSTFSPEGMGDAAAGIPPGIRSFWGLIPYPRVPNVCQKSPGRTLEIYTEFLLEFQSKIS